MKAERISLTISDICKKLDIDYCSVNPAYLQLITDANRLGEIFLDLKIIAEDLKEIGNRHNLNGISTLLEDDIHQLYKIDHDLIRLMNRIKEESRHVD